MNNMQEIIIGSAAAILGAISGFFINLKKTNSDVTTNLQEGYSASLDKLAEMTDKWQDAEKEMAEVRAEVAELRKAITTLTSILTAYKDKYGAI
jgi:hypothetical protein